MREYTRTFRSYTLLECLAVVCLMGTFLLVAGPLTVHLIYAVNGRTRTYDQLFQVSRIGDKIRFDLHGPPGGPAPHLLAVEPARLLIGSPGQTIEYRTHDEQFERIESPAQKPRKIVAWKIPCVSLTFSRQQGKPGMALVELHWLLSRAGDHRTLTKRIPVEMAFAVREDLHKPLEQEKQ